MQICRVEPAHVALIWPLVSSFIAAALRRGYGQFYDESDIRDDCISGAAQLWVACGEAAIEAAIVSRIVRYPKRVICQVPLIGGRRMRDWLGPMERALEAFARDHSCTHMEGGGRRGWCRAAGYRNVGPVLIKELSP
jgi:hypothetical protein